MTMEEMWNVRASSIKSSAQPGPSATNQFNMDPGQFSQPYMAKEVCVIERTFRQDPMLTNSIMNFGSQGLHPDKLRSELLAMVSGSPQHAAKPSYASSLSGRSPYAASLSQFSQMNLPDLGGYSGWPSQSPSTLSQANRGDGGAKSSTGADASLGQGRDFNVMTGGRTQDSLQTVNGSRAPVAEVLTHSSLSFGRGAGELGMEGSWNLPSSQWSTEPARQRQQRNQSSSTLFSTNSGDPCKGGVSAPLNTTGSGFLSQSQSVPAPTSSGGLRIYCISYFGIPVVGQLGLTDAGRMGVTCTCHGQHMSVAKFTQHSGLNAVNPGEVVHMEGGETLVQWRKSFFSQYGVKVPEDSLGWEWLDVGPPMEAGHGNGKYKAAVSATRSWQKEVDVSCGGSTPMMKSRTTTQQMWDASLSNGNASTLHATESISNTKYGLLSSAGNNGGMLDSREAMLKSYGQSHKSMASDLGSGKQFFSATSTHENHYSRVQVNMGASSTFQSMLHSGHLPMSNGHNGLMSNGGGPRYNSLTGQQQQVSGGLRQSGSGASHPPAMRLSEGQESRMREADISSSFELRLGQPSQQTQAAGTSFSIATSSVEHPKSHLFEQVMNKVWDGKLQHNLQQFNPANLPKFSGIPGQARDQEDARQLVHGRTAESLENGVVERRGEERGSGANSTALSQSPRQLSHNASQAGFRADGVSELQEKLLSLESLQNQSDMLSRSGDRQFRREPSGSEKLAAKLFPHTAVGPSRSVTLENGTTLDSLSSGALVQLSKKTGQRLLETAIQSSFTYRAMGLEGPAAGASQLSGVTGSQLFGQLDAYGWSNFAGDQRARFAEFLVRNQLGQNGSELAVASANGSRSLVEHYPDLRAFQMREQAGTTLMKQQHSLQRVVVEECSERRGMVELGRGSGGEQEAQMRESLMTVRNGTELRSEEQQGTVMDRQGRGRSQGGPEAESTAHPGLELSKVPNGAVIPSRLSQGLGDNDDKEGERMDVQSQPLADLAARDVRGLATGAVSTQEGVEVPALSEGDIQCSCLKCRKASPSVRGQAVPRLAGQVCLKERAGLASTVEAARTVEMAEGEKGPAQVEQPDMDVRKCTVDSGRDGVEEVDDERDDEGTPENEEDVLLDTAAKGTAATAAGGRGSPRTAGEATPDVGVCSNSSENVSSGLSDGGCVLSEKGGPGVMQESGTTGVPSVVDEGSGIGKCCSSDGVDMGVGRQTNALSSALEDHCKVEGSPSSLGCPSSSNIRQRLVVKRGGMRGHTGGCHGSSVMELDNEVEAEPVASTGKLERKQRRNMKWKWLGSGGGHDGDAKEGSPGKSSFGQEAEPQVTSETARMGSKNVQKAATTPDASKRDLMRAWSGEMVPPSKRRKLLVPRRHQEVKATNVTEENLEAAMSLGEDSSKKKVGTTLVIRVPQGVNRQKAKKGIRTKLQQQLKFGTPRDWKADAGEEGRAGSGDGRRELEAGKSTASRAARPPMKVSIKGCGSGSGSGGAGGAGLIPVPSLVTKSIRSPRTPLVGPSPRNGRMVSLSVILNQPAAAIPAPRTVKDSRVPVQKLTRDGVANSISRREGTTPKRSDAHVGSVSGVTGRHVKEVKNRGGPSHNMGVAWNATEGSRTRVVQKKVDAQSRKVRSMLELTGKDDVHGSGASVFEFAEEEDHVTVVPRATGKQQATASAAVQTDSPLPGPGAGPGRLGTNSCPFPRGERSARPGGPNKRKVEWHRSKDAQAEAAAKSSSLGAEKMASEKGRTYVCKVSQVRSAAGSSISKEKLQQGLHAQGFPVRKQVRSSKAKRSNVAMGERSQAKDGRGVLAEGVGVAEKNQKVRQLQLQGPGHVKGVTTGNGVLKRRSELSIPGMSVKRPRVVFGLRKVKEGVVGDIERSIDSGAQLKSQRGLCLEQKKTEALVEDPLAGSGKIQKREKSQMLDVNGRSSTWRKERGGGGVPGNQLGQGEKCGCDVCGTFSSASYNKLLCCGRCPVKVHQACYGVPKVPKGQWICRICKFKVTNPICVLCGYGGGAMTRVQKARPLCQTLLQTWRELKNENACASVLEEEDDDETLLSATNSIQLSRARSAGGPTGMPTKKRETKVRECESCDFAESRDEGSVCKVCGKGSPEPGSSGGNGVKGSERGAVMVRSQREYWRRSNTVGSIVEDAGAKQWAHMVCTLWMPGTRCLNMGTMGAFDVSGVTASRRKALCSICLRKGGACIQCRVPKCSTPFHVWCAHEKGLLQSETVQDGSNKVGFFGKCLSHAISSGIESEDVMEDVCPSSGGSCARTEGYKGRLSLEERATAQQKMTLEGATAVTPEQVAVWLRISDRKMTARRVLKSTNPTMKFDHREYLRFKQKKGWRKLAVCKSGIHALGLYTTDFIAEGEVVVEYVGEIVGLRVADKREAEYHSGKRLQYQGACYLFRIDSEQIIDATRKGGIARFVNHSCSPNCVAKVICVDNLKKVIFFAKRDIYAGEEVTYDYKFNYDEVGDKIPCFCGTPECRGTLN